MLLCRGDTKFCASPFFSDRWEKSEGYSCNGGGGDVFYGYLLLNVFLVFKFFGGLFLNKFCKYFFNYFFLFVQYVFLCLFFLVGWFCF